MKASAFVVALCAVACAPARPAPAPPDAPQRIVSLDYCADQYVLALAERETIAAVSIDADKPFSAHRERAAGLAQVRARAEDVLALKPDLVVRAFGGGPQVEALLSRAGAPSYQLGFPQSLQEAADEMRAAAAAFGAPARGEGPAAALEAIAARPPDEGPRPTALYVTPAGVTTGPGGLVSALIEAAGYAPFDPQPGWRPIPVERLAREQPDLVVAAAFGARFDRLDAWSASGHPVVRRALAERPVAQIDGAWTACGGFFAAEAVAAMRAAREIP